MKCRTVVVGGLVAALAVAPISSAWARDRDHFRGGFLFWPFAAAAAVVVGAAELVTLPFRVLAGPPGYYQSPGYYPGPGYYAPPPGYAPAPAYYAPPQAYPGPGYYAPPQGYPAPANYAPAPTYYAPQQGYAPPPPGYTVTPR